MDLSPAGASARLAGLLLLQPLAEVALPPLPIGSAPKAVKRILMPRRRDVSQTVELLCDRHGEAKAAKLAASEQKRARQARSRRQFGFWAAVLVEIELRRGIAPEDREVKQLIPVAQQSGEVVVTKFLEGEVSE